jgi:NTP pyrophosphatase (non-canonical NTP hydrolase)
MKENEYELFVAKLIDHRLGSIPSPELHMLLGLVTETGELADAYKKQVGYEQPINMVNVVEEMGDILFYLTGLCYEVGITLNDLKQWNMVKLNKRYPEGFTAPDALARKDKQ